MSDAPSPFASSQEPPRLLPRFQIAKNIIILIITFGRQPKQYHPSRCPEMILMNTNRISVFFFFLLPPALNGCNICRFVMDKTSRGGGRQKVRPIARNTVGGTLLNDKYSKDWVTFFFALLANTVTLFSSLFSFYSLRMFGDSAYCVCQTFRKQFLN